MYSEEVPMRKVVAAELVSLDGVMEKPEEWSFSYSNDEMAEANAAGMAASDAMLLGRVTYGEFASYWPYQNRAEQPFTEYMDNTPKYVVSTSLEEPLEWQNSTLIKGNVAEEIAKLKRQPGKDITILGSGALVRSLLEEDLLDEFSLMVHPVRPGQREAPLRGRERSEDAGACRLEDVQHRCPLPHLPAGAQVKPLEGRGTLPILYAPKCLEGKFSEVGLPLYGVLGS
jgi:dihydrofolate reductase